ncbi:hypothetical protein BJ170DRAFT_120071 [Xylariales sp. AK1849]|nr:hypothetical protein BJ170DRAFT_120071 [Xylariales sp. AK1849]
MFQYAIKDPEASTKGHLFQEEVISLWRAERGYDSLTKLSGLQILYVAINAGSGQSALATTCLNESIDIAMRLRLFGTVDRLCDAEFDAISYKDQRWTASTTWGAFNQLTMTAFVNTTKPLEYPPALPVPATITISIPPEEGRTFMTFCTFWTIVCQVLLVYRVTDQPQKVSLSFAYFQYNKLLLLADGLGDSMRRSNDRPSHVFIFQNTSNTASQHGL